MAQVFSQPAGMLAERVKGLAEPVRVLRNLVEVLRDKIPLLAESLALSAEGREVLGVRAVGFIRPAALGSWAAVLRGVHCAIRETKSLSTRFLSMSTTSMRRPSHSKWSLAVGMRPRCNMTRPPTVWKLPLASSVKPSTSNNS